MHLNARFGYRLSMIFDGRTSSRRLLFSPPGWEQPSTTAEEKSLAGKRASNQTCSLLPVGMPVGLTHLDSDLCWCDPIVEVDDDGEHVLLHRQVTWN